MVENIITKNQVAKMLCLISHLRNNELILDEEAREMKSKKPFRPCLCLFLALHSKLVYQVE